MKQTDTAAEEIDLIVTATVTPDMLFPATSCLIQNRLGATRAWGFDLSAACSGFLYALTVGAQFAGAGTHRKVLVIGSDVMSSIIDYKDRNTCVLFGDGAGAVLVEPAEAGEPCILDFHHDIDGSGGEFLFMPGGGSLHPPTHETVNENMHVVHQAGSQGIQVRGAPHVRSRLPVAATERLFYTRSWRWWCRTRPTCESSRPCRSGWAWTTPRSWSISNGSATPLRGTIPLGLRDAVAQGRLHKGDLVLLLAVGAGFTTGGMLLRWAY